MLIKNNLGEMWIARTPEGEPASADFIVWDNKQVYMWIAATDEQFKKTSAASLLQLEIFQDLQKRGFHEINMMSGNMSNLSTFASAFNPRLVTYYGVEKSKFMYPRLQTLERISQVCDALLFRLKG